MALVAFLWTQCAHHAFIQVLITFLRVSKSLQANAALSSGAGSIVSNGGRTLRSIMNNAEMSLKFVDGVERLLLGGRIRPGTKPTDKTAAVVRHNVAGHVSLGGKRLIVVSACRDGALLAGLVALVMGALLLLL